jgi:flavin-dependent dehydrogenase
MHRSITGIAGAGLAGLTTAIGLSQVGQPVEIFESAPDSGWGRKGSLDAVENWTTEADFMDLLDNWNISHNFDYWPVRSIDVYETHGECYTITSSRPIIYLVKRGNHPGALEHNLKEQALDSGVTIHYKERRDRKDVDVWAVGAQHQGQFLAVGLRFQTHHADTVKLLISTSHAPKAYAYLFVLNGQAVLSVILTRNFPNARYYLQRSLEFFRKVIPLDIENERMMSGFGGRMADFFHSATSPLRVGEAAGFQDYLWGFGIRYALHSGYLAAQAITQGTDYYRAVRTQIWPLVYTSLFNRAAYNRAGDRIYHLLIEMFSRSPQLVELLRSRYSPSIPRQLMWLLQQAKPDSVIQGRFR